MAPDEQPSKRLRKKMVAAVKEQVISEYVPHTPPEQLHMTKGVVMKQERSEASVRASRHVEIEKWHSRKVVLRWNRDDAMKTGAKIFSSRWVDHPKDDKSRYCIREFNTGRDDNVFAAASDSSTSRLIEFKASKNGYCSYLFDVTSAFTHADEDELIFLEPPEEEKEVYGDCLWQALKVIYGRRKGARSWQDLFREIVLSEEAKKAGFTVRVHHKCPTIFYIEEADGVMELHVDDGHACGKSEVMKAFMVYLASELELKYVCDIGVGDSYEYLKCIRMRDETGITICPSEKYLKSALAKYGMEACTPSTSPKVLKSEEPGDDEPLDAEAASTFRSATLTLLYMSNERTDMQSSVRDLCCRLKEPNAGDLRRLKKVLRYGRGTSGMCTHFPAASSKDRVLRVFSDSNWANDKDSRKSTSGAVIMCEGCRLHAHSRGQDAVALSSCEAELYAASEAVKEAVIL